jgi:hypothetical protein
MGASHDARIQIGLDPEIPKGFVKRGTLLACRAKLPLDDMPLPELVHQTRHFDSANHCNNLVIRPYR